MTIPHRLLVRGALLALLVILPAHARAVEHPDSCEYTCTSDCELDQDIVCSGNPGIGLSAGADLDLKGHRIICDNPLDPEGVCAGLAIGMSGGNSVVTDTGYPKGGIYGHFAVAIDCGGYATNRVSGLTMIGIDGKAVGGCGTVDGNVIISRTQLDYVDRPGIEANSITATIRNNYVANFGLGIYATGTKAVTIDGNVVEPQAPLGGVGFSLIAPKAILNNFNTSATSRVTNNTVLGPAGIIAVNDATFVENNRCDETSADCQACITDPTHPACTGPAVPYLLDRSVTLKPRGLGDSNQFTLLYPSSGVTGGVKWLLVADVPDGDTTGYFRSSIGNSVASSVKTQLFTVDYLENLVDPDDEYQSCVLEARMQGLNAPTYLVVKIGGTQSDGTPFNVNTQFPTLFTRAMTSRPAGGKWTGADLLDPSLQIGVKNGIGPTGGTTFGDIVMRCK